MPSSRILRVTPKSKGLAGRLRWVLQADFDTLYGFTPHFGEKTNDAWDEALVAVEDGQVVGCLRWDRLPTAKMRGMRAGGTWIAPTHRGGGLAKSLWRRALCGIRVVEVTTVSRGGTRLVESLAKGHPKVSWVTNLD